MTTGKTIALTRRTFVGKVMSLLFNILVMMTKVKVMMLEVKMMMMEVTVIIIIWW